MEEADAAVRGVPDAEEHEVKFLGRVPVEASPSRPPDGDDCAAAIRKLTRLHSRGKYREGVAKHLLMRVSCKRNGIFCKDLQESGQGGIRQCLLQITCVADHGRFLCYTVGRFDETRTLVCHAYAFECESEFAATYLGEEIVKACRANFERARILRGSSQPPSGQASAQSPSRSPSDTPSPAENSAPNPPKPSDLALFENMHALEQVLREARRNRQPHEYRTPRRSKQGPPPDRGDGLWHVCCSNLGKCVCKSGGEAGAAAGAAVGAAGGAAAVVVDLLPSAAKHSDDEEMNASTDSHTMLLPDSGAGSSDLSRITATSVTHLADNLDNDSDDDDTCTLHIDPEALTGIGGGQLSPPTSPSTVGLPKLYVGLTVAVQGYGQGIIRYIGPSKVAGGPDRCGVELKEPCGDCDGSLPAEGRYFRCATKHGLLFRPGDKIISVINTVHKDGSLLPLESATTSF